MIDATDARNILVLLDRVQVTGLKEAQVLAHTSAKLQHIINEVEDKPADGKDNTSAD